MMCPQENNVTNLDEKETKYRQLTFELRERRSECKIYVIPVIIGALCGCIKEAIYEVKKIIKQDDSSKKIVGEMQRTVKQLYRKYCQDILMDSETIIQKILLGLVQIDFPQIYLYLTSLD